MKYNIYLDNFDWDTYINNSDNLIETKINTKNKAIKHWIKYGKNKKKNFLSIKKNNIRKYKFLI